MHQKSLFYIVVVATHLEFAQSVPLKVFVEIINSLEGCQFILFSDSFQSGFISSKPLKIYSLANGRGKYEKLLEIDSFKTIRCYIHILAIQNEEKVYATEFLPRRKRLSSLQKAMTKISSRNIQPHYALRGFEEEDTVMSVMSFPNYVIHITEYFEAEKTLAELISTPVDYPDRKKIFYENMLWKEHKTVDPKCLRFYFGLRKIQLVVVKLKKNVNSSTLLGDTNLWAFTAYPVPQFVNLTAQNEPVLDNFSFFEISKRLSPQVWALYGTSVQLFDEVSEKQGSLSCGKFRSYLHRSSDVSESHEEVLHAALFHHIIQRCNTSFEWEDLPDKHFWDEALEKSIILQNQRVKYRPFYPAIVLDDNVVINNVDFVLSQGLPSGWVFLKQKGFSFLTCQADKYVSFLTYFQPFQLPLWIALFFNLIILAVTMHVWLLKVKEKLLGNFSSYFVLYATILEQSRDIPSQISEKDVFRITFGEWCLLSIIFTNAYKGIAITGVTSPLPAKQPQKFEELSEYVFQCEPRQPGCNEKYEWERLAVGGKGDFKLLSHSAHYFKPLLKNYIRKGDIKIAIWHSKDPKNYNLGNSLDQFRNNFPDFYDDTEYEYGRDFSWTYESKIMRTFCRVPDHYIKDWLARNSHFFGEDARRKPRVWQLSIPRDILIGVEFSIEKELIECGRTALVDHVSSIHREFDHLTSMYKDWPFVKSDEIIYNNLEGIFFYYEDNSCMRETLQILVESGIHSFFDKHILAAYYGGRRRQTRNSSLVSWERVKPIKLNDTIQTIYYVSAVLVSLTFVYFYAEVGFGRRLILGKIFRVFLKLSDSFAKEMIERIHLFLHFELPHHAKLCCIEQCSVMEAVE